MIIDTSAIIAILVREPKRDRLLEAIAAAPQCSIAAPTLLETSIALSKFGPLVTGLLANFIVEAEIAIVPFDAVHLAAAQEAHRRFGKGTGHGAPLNYGDCFSYAASAVSGQPLLFTGDDFSQTDILCAL